MINVLVLTDEGAALPVALILHGLGANVYMFDRSNPDDVDTGEELLFVREWRPMVASVDIIIVDDPILALKASALVHENPKVHMLYLDQVNRSAKVKEVLKREPAFVWDLFVASLSEQLAPKKKRFWRRS